MQNVGVETDEFWTLVDQARADADTADRLPTGAAVGAALADRLAALPQRRILEFDRRFAATVAWAHQWETCAAAFVIWQYISDDSFADFKAGLIGLGRQTFERAVAEPDDLADDPTVLAIAAGRLDKYAMNGELIQSAASRAYDRLTDDPDAFWDALDAMRTAEGDGQQPGARWDGRFGGPDDRARIPLRLPRLSALFDVKLAG